MICTRPGGSFCRLSNPGQHGSRSTSKVTSARAGGLFKTAHNPIASIPTGSSDGARLRKTRGCAIRNSLRRQGNETFWEVMFVRTEPWVAITMLALLMAFRNPSLDYETLLQVVVSAAACGVAWQMGKEGKYVLAAAFAAIAVLFNPLVPLTLSPEVFPWVGLTSVVMFVHALDLVKPTERMPLASIVDGIKRSESAEGAWAWKR
jgi:hypothetical protein